MTKFISISIKTHQNDFHIFRNMLTNWGAMSAAKRDLWK